jgi:two-component system, LytTR family, response regulator
VIVLPGFNKNNRGGEHSLVRAISPHEPKIRTIVVLDGTAQNQFLLSLSSYVPALETVGIADGVVSALKLIEEKSPELVVLDSDIPLNAVAEIFDRTGSSVSTAFICSGRGPTLRLFDIRESVEIPTTATHGTLEGENIRRFEEPQRDLLQQQRKLSSSDPILLKLNDKFHVVRVGSILFISSSRHYTYVATIDGKKGIASKSIGVWESRLPLNSFVRIHRNAIVNLDHVDRIEGVRDHSFQLYLHGLEKPLAISSRCFARVKRQLN